MNKRLTYEERKLSIIQAALPLFAEKGLDGTKTRELAKAAKVTDALIYKIFPTKELLFQGVLEYTLAIKESGWNEIAENKKGFNFLASLIDLFLSECLSTNRNPDLEYAHKLVLKSLTTDGKFAKRYFTEKMSALEEIISESYEIAWKNGELEEKHMDAKRQNGWIVHHLLIAFSIFNFSSPSLSLYKVSKSKLKQDTLLFVLRGIGFKDAILHKHFGKKISK
ncbi:transcriptional regulator, TetR family [Leptospira ryugenii]|uniref:Transcriptional regulator, TetR family n=1 Tax=Leptospira ryugenii TaxID=1917863 RepID=A0A2P2E2Z6_9LEPT|nr:TetR/AcrR family transcriptional regulator [Leptospira ryugenii]GBF51247.1 transcriptional regulator, TetR family [Leptospira ryugenii]